MNIVFLGKFGHDVVAPAIEQVPGAVLHSVDTADEFAAVTHQMEGLVMSGPAYTEPIARLVAGASRLRWIQTLSAGYESLQRLGVPAGVTVTNAGDAWSVSVAEHALALMLALAKRLPDAIRQQQRRAWDRELMERMSSLYGRTLVIVGFGSIGKAVAQRAKALGMKIIAVMSTPKPSEHADKVFGACDLEQALGEADAVLLAVPSTSATANLMNQQTLRACKPGCVLINVARGNVVDTEALLEALHSGRLGGAGLDVVDLEPLPDSSPVWGAPNLLITPHIAGGGELVTRILAELVSENVARQLKGQPLRCVVIP